MIIVHHLNESRSQRILWLLEELGVPYEICFYERNKLTMLAPPELKKVHPLGKSPVLTDGTTTVAESGAIIEYLIDKYSKVKMGGTLWRPEGGSEEFLRYRYWLHYAEGSLMTPILLTLIFNKIKDQAVPFFVKPLTLGIANTVLSTYVKPELKNHLTFIENELEKSTWFAGESISGADIQMSFPLEAAISKFEDKNKWPNISNFLSRIQSRPAYMKALKTGSF